jgi:fatty-acyl-CoA synthase
MFHVNAWSFPFVSVLNGTKIIFLGKDLSPGHITKWLLQERVTVATGVPTLWLGVYQELKNAKAPKLPSLKIISGGSAVPASLIDGNVTNKSHFVIFKLTRKIMV